LQMTVHANLRRGAGRDVKVRAAHFVKLPKKLGKRDLNRGIVGTHCYFSLKYSLGATIVPTRGA
jgi:hypothetical protein